MASGTQLQAQIDEIDSRVEDYLDDKLQSTIDFENLDSLVASVESQRAQLESQLDDATKQLAEARQSTEVRQAALRVQLDEFDKLQKSIDKRLQIVAGSDAPDEAMRRLERPMKQLHKLKLAQGYLELLRDVETSQAEARSHLPASPKAALEPYSRLKQLSLRLTELQGATDGAAVHLVSYVGAVTDALWSDMKTTMWEELEALLGRRGWPRVDPDSLVDEEWSRCFEKLVDLQVLEVLHSRDVVTLLPMDVMAQIFVKEFRFHFMSDKPSSSPQHMGSHCFPWFSGLVERWEFFLRDNFGPMLASRFRDTPVAAKMVYMDPVCAFIASMLPVLREKVDSVMAEAIKDGSFLSSTMAQILSFDESLRSDFNYDGGDTERGWGGLASEVLDKHYDKWLQAEKDFALDRYRAIIATPDASHIDYEYAGSGKTKPTYGAIRVTDLLRSVTGQYEKLPRFSHQLRFLIDIQLGILDEYHDLLRGSLEAYSAITSTVGRTLHGVTKEQLSALDGTGAFETLCKVYGSCDHVINTLRDWGNQEVFVALWERLQTRARTSDGQGDMAGGLSYNQIKDLTSSAVGTDGDGGILFDETIAAYNQRRKRAQDFLTEALIESHYKAFRAYVQKVQWTTVCEDSSHDAYQLAITAELDEPLRILKRNLDFFTRTLGTAVVRRIWRDALDKLTSMLWSDVLMSQNFTTPGAAQFVRDLDAICSLVDRYIRNGAGAMESLTDAARLLDLPVAGENEGHVTLKQASDMVFTDNTEAKRLLELIGVRSLTPANARHILQRRVENSE